MDNMREKHFEMKKLGEQLYNSRNKKGISLEQAAESTRIRYEYLDALERGDYKELPADVYTKGFIRNYSIFLGLNPEVTLALFRRENSSATPASKLKKITEPKKEGFSLRLTQDKLLILFVIVFVVGFLGYIFTRVNSVLKPPELQVESPVEAQSGETQIYRTDKDKISIKGTIEVGSTLKFNNVDFDTKNLSVFEIKDIKLNEGENNFNLVATNDFGIETQINITVIRESSQTEDPEPPTEIEEVPLEDMLVEVIVGPDEANLKIIIDNVEIQNKVEQPGVKTFRAKSSVKIQTPRPNSVRVAINGQEFPLTTGDEVEWVLLDGTVVQR